MRLARPTVVAALYTHIPAEVLARVGRFEASGPRHNTHAATAGPAARILAWMTRAFREVLGPGSPASLTMGLGRLAANSEAWRSLRRAAGRRKWARAAASAP